MPSHITEDCEAFGLLEIHLDLLSLNLRMQEMQKMQYVAWMEGKASLLSVEETSVNFKFVSF